MALESSTLDIINNPISKQHASRPYAPLQSRDKPAMRRPQFQHEFTTDSLNNTGIGSPSPARPLGGNLGRTNASTRGGGLSAAFRRVNEQSNNNVDKKESSGDPRRPDRPLYRPVFSRQHMSDSPPSMPRVVPSRSATRTPSPPRVRAQDVLLSPMSEVSESSPPREFAEAYKQINDAEILAAQDEDMDTTDEADIVVAEDDARLLQLDPVLQLEHRNRRSNGMDDAIILESPQLQTTQDSMPSLPSNLRLNTHTTEAATTSQREKDLQRLNTTLGEAKAFSKAKPRPKLGMNGFQRDDGSLGSGSRSGSSNTSGSILSDGSLNIPSAWGRKARQGRSWLSRVNRDGVGDENQLPPARSTWQEENKSHAIQNWQIEASMTPLPEVLQEDLLEGSPSPAVDVVSARDRVRKLAFGSTMSSFPDNPKTQMDNPAADSTSRREVQGLSEANFERAQDVERRLAQIRGRSVAFGADDIVEYTARSDDEIPVQEPLPRTGLHAFDGGPKLYGTRNPIDDGALSDISKTRSDKNEAAERLSIPTALRHDLLPQNDAAHSKNQQDKPSSTGVKNSGVEAKLESEPKLRTPAPNKPETYLKTPIVTGAWIDTPVPTVKSEYKKDEPAIYDTKESVRGTLKKLDLEHLVDTSRVIREADIKQQTLQETAPRLPGSALAAIINRAKDKKAQGIGSQSEDTLLLDDSTILSLEELLANAEDSDSSILDTVKSTESQAKAAVRTVKHRISRNKSTVEDSDSDSDVGLTTRLDRLKTSIHDAKADVGSLQKRINKLPNKSVSASSSRSHSRSRAQSECEEAGELHDFIWPCEKCGHKVGSSTWNSDSSSLLEWQWRPLQIYMPQLWYWPAGFSLPRFTRLGWCSTIACLLVITELILCDMYSPPFYATRMYGYGVDINAPRPPFVLAQLLWRHVLSSPLDTVQMLLRTVVRFFAGAIGALPETFGTANDPSGSIAGIKWSYRPGIIVNDQADALGMDEDEFI